MSGIAGIFYLDGRPAEQETIDKMVGAMKHRGPDGIHTWREGAVALGHCMLHTTPESLHDTLPMESRDGNLVLTADARIDNREELMRILDLRPDRDRPVTDCDLIMAAYQKWREDCPKRLVGAFAFAMWDKRNQRLLCARDHFGVKPLFWHHHAGGVVAFASEIEALFAGTGLEKRPNDLQAAAFVAGLPEVPSTTFYEGINEVLARHMVRATPEAVESTGYWDFDQPEVLRLGSDDAYVAAFQEVFDEAVRCRMRSIDGMGTELSGGLDSSSIAGVACQIHQDPPPVHSFTNVYPDFPTCDEWAYVNLLRRPGLELHKVEEAPQTGYPSRLAGVLKDIQQPFGAPNIAGCKERYTTARRHARVLLSGHGGDETISTGWGRLKELAAARSYVDLWRECYPLAQSYDEATAPALFLGYLRVYGGGRLRTLLTYGRHARRRVFSRWNRKPKDKEAGLLAEQWQAHPALEEHRQQYHALHSSNKTTERDTHYAIVSSHARTSGFNTLGQLSATCAIELRFPMWDRRIVEFCLSLPAEQKLRRGQGRFILRQSMAGVLPDEVRWRRGKTDFRQKFQSDLRSLTSKTDAISTEAASYVNIKQLRRLRKLVIDDTVGAQGANLLWHAFVLNLWLEDM